MKMLKLTALAILALLVVRPAHAAWETVASPHVGKQADGLLLVAAASDNDVWTVGLSFNQQLFAYRTLIERWNGAKWVARAQP